MINEDASRLLVVVLSKDAVIASMSESVRLQIRFVQNNLEKEEMGKGEKGAKTRARSPRPCPSGSF